MSQGGRGGRVLRVTNLNDSGPGSLRAAVGANGPRIIVFDVGGTIRLKSPLSVRNGRVTIAGQTAPGGGITLRDYGLRVGADDVVVRFIRSRPGDLGDGAEDAISIGSGRRIIVDHVSASWGVDETLSVSPNWRRGDNVGDVTVQWSIISESLCGESRNPKERHCYGSLVGGARGARISFHHNLWAHHRARMPRPGNQLPPSQDPVGGFFDFRGNVIYNWGGRRAGYNDGPNSKVAYNFVDNSYWTGPDSSGTMIFDEHNPSAVAYFAGNSLDGRLLADQWAEVRGSQRAGYRLRAPVPSASVATQSAAAAFERVLRDAGASRVRDAVDARVVASARSRTGSLIDSQQQVGGWPALAPGRPWVDGDGDGMPDDWERTHSLDPGDPRDGNGDQDRDGYTNVEEWLHSLA